MKVLIKKFHILVDWWLPLNTIISKIDNEVSNLNRLAKKTNYGIKMFQIKEKYLLPLIKISFMSGIIDARMKQK